MTNISDLLKPKTKEIASGEVEGRNGSVFLVRKEGVTVSAKLGMEYVPQKGDKVVLSYTDSGLYIVGKGETLSRKVKEHIING